MGEIKSLKSSREEGNLDDFIKEHEADPNGDLDKLDALIKRPTQGTVKASPPASPNILNQVLVANVDMCPCDGTLHQGDTRLTLHQRSCPNAKTPCCKYPCHCLKEFLAGYNENRTKVSN